MFHEKEQKGEQHNVIAEKYDWFCSGRQPLQLQNCDV